MTHASTALIPKCDINKAHGWAVTKVITDDGPGGGMAAVHVCNDCRTHLTSDPAKAAHAWSLIPVAWPL